MNTAFIDNTIPSDTERSPQPTRKEYPTGTPNEIRAMIRDLELDRFDWKPGSLEGFVLFVFSRWTSHTIGEIADLIVEYLAECLDAGEDGAKDDELREFFAPVEAMRAEYNEETRDLITFVTNAKWGSEGAVVWDNVCFYATSHARALPSSMTVEVADRILEVLREIDSIEMLKPAALAAAKDYVPGAHPVRDILNRTRLKNMDRAVEEAADWSGAEPCWLFELGLLLRIANDAELITLLDELS